MSTVFVLSVPDYNGLKYDLTVQDHDLMIKLLQTEQSEHGQFLDTVFLKGPDH